MLALLENYVLDVLGEIDDEKRASLLAIVTRVYGGGKDWRIILRSQLHFAPSMDASIQRLWKENQSIAASRSETLHPIQFAKMFADANFSHLFTPASENGA